jgi:hypothetical protein
MVQVGCALRCRWGNYGIDRETSSFPQKTESGFQMIGVVTYDYGCDDRRRRNLKKLCFLFLATIPAYIICGYFLRNTTLPRWLFYVPFAILLYDVAVFPYRFRSNLRHGRMGFTGVA